MGDTQQNGDNNPRMDRLERMLEMLIGDHVKFSDEHNKLLTSQILLTDRMDKLTDGMDKLTNGMDRLTGRMDRLTETMQELAESQKATDGRMTILIGVMDTFVRERGDRQ